MTEPIMLYGYRMIISSSTVICITHRKCIKKYLCVSLLLYVSKENQELCKNTLKNFPVQYITFAQYMF